MSEQMKQKLWKIFKGALISGGAVAITYILQSLSVMDFGQWTPVVQGIIGVLINAAKVLK